MRRPRGTQRRETFLLPDVPEPLNRRRRVATVMIVCERVDQHTSFYDLITKIDPAAQFCGTVNHSLIPSHGLLFNRPAIT